MSGETTGNQAAVRSLERPHRIVDPPGVGEESDSSRAPGRERGPQRRSRPFEPERALEPVGRQSRQAERLGEEPLAPSAEEIHLEQASPAGEVALSEKRGIR